VDPVGFRESPFVDPAARSGADPVIVHPADTVVVGVAGVRGPRRFASACSAGSERGPIERTPEPPVPVLNFLGTTRVYLAVGATDLRKSFDTLAGVVRNALRLDPLSGHLFAFTNSRRNRLKILFWDRNGWWLCSKRLESGTLSWPASESASVELSSEELTLLLSGIDLSKTQRRPWLDRRPKGADENSAESP
jgi:transposase